MNGRLVVALLIACALVGGSIQLFAHHSFVASYREDKIIKIEGKLVQFQFKNPHSFVHVEAPDETGVMRRWSVEWGGAGQLGGQGVSRETLKPGETVIITGNPGRNPAEHRMHMLSLLRPSDGFGWGNKPGERYD